MNFNPHRLPHNRTFWRIKDIYPVAVENIARKGEIAYHK